MSKGRKIFKVYVRTTDDEPMATNAMEYATEAEAKAAGEDLFSRWMAVKAWEVREEDSRKGGE